MLEFSNFPFVQPVSVELSKSSSTATEDIVQLDTAVLTAPDGAAHTVGAVVIGANVGATVGKTVGMKVGKTIGEAVIGAFVGATVGKRVGVKVGKGVGEAVIGAGVGFTVGRGLGMMVGKGVGEKVIGAGVGEAGCDGEHSYAAILILSMPKDSLSRS
jgi:hypothetical protein